MGNVKENLLRIQEDIAPYTTNIIAVTKYFDESKLIEAYEAGIRDFGESRIPEAIDKINRLPEDIRKNSRFHFIGHLQSNKVKKVVGFFDYIHSVDSVKLAEEIAEEATSKGIVQKIFVQVNNANEEQKFGFSKDDIFQSFGGLKTLKGIDILGIMNIAPFGVGEEVLKKLFLDIRNLRDELEETYNCELKELSMGMSCDYKQAVEAGATMVRIGRKLFQ
ncbi:MAG: YggS family pyridoxal phosphate-dependent enzyme [bacterium]|nr:YggS family pyridoxal phosphate-dependent enzyme [bacterium]